MMEIDDRERGERSLLSFREIRGAKARLTEAQSRVLAALAAGYTVCMSTSSSVPYHEAVMIGNGSRLSSATVESLQFRGLIEQAERLLEPQPSPSYPDHWRKRIIVFQLTEPGRHEILRQGLQFVPEEVVCSLPCTVRLLLEEMARYQIRYICEPEVAISGVMDAEQYGWCVRIPIWRRILAYNEAQNLLGLEAAGRDPDEEKLLWVRPPASRKWSLTSAVRMRLRPAGASCTFSPGS